MGKNEKRKGRTFGEHLAKVFEPFPSHNKREDEQILAVLESPGQLDLPITEFNIKSALNVKRLLVTTLLLSKF